MSKDEDEEHHSPSVCGRERIMESAEQQNYVCTLIWSCCPICHERKHRSWCHSHTLTHAQIHIEKERSVEWDASRLTINQILSDGNVRVMRIKFQIFRLPLICVESMSWVRVRITSIWSIHIRIYRKYLKKSMIKHLIPHAKIRFFFQLILIKKILNFCY